jgi:hypothetical protein
MGDGGVHAKDGAGNLPDGRWDGAQSQVDSAPQSQVDSAPQSRVDSAPQSQVDSAPQSQVDSAPQNRVDSAPPDSGPPDQATPSPTFSLSAAPSTQSVAAGGSTTYTVRVTPSGGFDGTVGFTASGLPTGASASFNPTTVSGSNSTTMTVGTGSSTPVGSSTVTITGSAGSLSHRTVVTIVVNPGAPKGSLSGSMATPSGTQNLTSLGTVDWAHWGLTTAGSFDHKAGVTQLISNFTIVGTGPANWYFNNPVGYSWTNGTPTESATNSTTGIYVWGVGNGFNITAPADTTQRTLTVYVGVWRARGQMVAQLSDGSAMPYMDSTLSNVTTTALGAYTFAYKAASGGQTLSVTFTDIEHYNGINGNVTLQAATLR